MGCDEKVAGRFFGWMLMAVGWREGGREEAKWVESLQGGVKIKTERSGCVGGSGDMV